MFIKSTKHIPIEKLTVSNWSRSFLPSMHPEVPHSVRKSPPLVSTLSYINSVDDLTPH